MIRCPNCHAEVAPHFRYCPSCGHALYRPCGSCSEEMGVWMEYCPNCGRRGTDAETPDLAAAGALRLVTVLFGDVQGYTALSEHLSPEVVTEIMNGCFEVLSQPIVRYGGTIDKYVGDAIMARFGAPTAHEDDPVRAIKAALEMQDALKVFTQDVEARTGSQLAMRIGINTGQVMAGEVGSSALKQFTLMGNAVNLASRLEHEAQPGSILVGESTYRLAREAFEFEAVPPMRIRGQSELIRAYIPLRAKTVALGHRSGSTNRRLTLVGRDAELDVLGSYLAEAVKGEGRLVGLVGEPGVGKSRLADELWKRHAHEDLDRIYAVAPSFGESIPYAMLTGLTRGLLFKSPDTTEIQAADFHAAVRDLLGHEQTPDAVAILGDILGVAAGSASDVSQMEARSRQAMLTNILKLLLVSRSRRKPLVIILDDMHWADAASLAVFDQILTGIHGLPVIVLLLYRPSFSHPWSGLTFYRQINLREMPPEHARALLHEFLGSLDVPASFGDRVIEKSGGNPFFLEQILNSLVEARAIERRDGKWVPVHDVNSITVPDTIQGILLARLDQLSRSARSVLEVAAVIGRIFAYRLLQVIVDAERDLNTQLQQLQRQEFIFEKNLVPELEYMFKHSLTQDVVYNGLLERQRRVFHERVAETIETLGGALSDEQIPILAFHYGKSDKWEKGLEYSIAAGERARHLYANEDALQFLRQALDILDRWAPEDAARRLVVSEALGDTQEILARFEDAREAYILARDIATIPRDRARLDRKLGDLAQSQGRYAEAGQSYREAENQLAVEDDPTELALIWLSRARMDRSRGALDTASAACLQALSVSGNVDDMTLALLYYELGQVDGERGNFRSASGYLEAAARIWQQRGAPDRQAMAVDAQGSAAYQSGRLVAALEHFHQALEMHRRVAARHNAAQTLYWIGKTEMAMGKLESAVECFTEVLGVATDVDDSWLLASCQLELSLLYLAREDVKRATGLLDASYSAFKQMRNWRGAAQAMAVRADLFRYQGEIEPARTALRRAANLAKEMDDRRLSVAISIAMADLDMEEGREGAALHLETAASVARLLSDARLIALAEYGRGRLLARQGRIPAALRVFEDSAAALHACGAQLDAARSALDYATAASRVSSRMTPRAHQLLQDAQATFEQAGASHDLKAAQHLASRLSPLTQPAGEVTTTLRLRKDRAPR